MDAKGETKGGQRRPREGKGRPKGGQRRPRRGQGRPKGGQGEAKRGQREAKGAQREAQGRPRGGQGEARRGQRRPSQARDENKPKPGQGYPNFRSQKASLFGGPRLPKSSQNRESDFLKMSVSPGRRAHFEREGLAKPGQRGLAKPGQGREGQSRPSGEVRGVLNSLVLEAGGVHPPLKDGSPWTQDGPT